VILVFEKSPAHILRANLYKNHAMMRLDLPYAFLWKRNEPGAAEALTEEAQRATDEAEHFAQEQAPSPGNGRSGAFRRLIDKGSAAW